MIENISFLVHGIDISMIFISLCAAICSIFSFSGKNLLICTMLSMSLSYIRHIIIDIYPLLVDKIIFHRWITEFIAIHPDALFYAYKAFIVDVISIVILSIIFYFAVSICNKVFNLKR